MQPFALLILTMAAGEPPRVTLSEMATMQDCTEARSVVSAILTTSGSPPLHALCGPNALQLTPFEHGTPPEEWVHRYRVTVTPEAFSIAPLSATAQCIPAPQATPATYCARSGQAPIP